MTAIRRTFAALVLGSAIAARPALGQQGSSVSLTHTVTVTVPPRVKVQVGSVASMSSAPSQSSVRSDALTVSVSATRAWVLSIGSAKGSQVQWSTDAAAGFASIGRRDATIAAGEISQVPAAATLFFRNASVGKVAEQIGGESSEPVILTVAAP
jgi:hypothetical protein